LRTREIADKYNATHEPEFLSRKAEIEEPDMKHRVVRPNLTKPDRIMQPVTSLIEVVFAFLEHWKWRS